MRNTAVALAVALLAALPTQPARAQKQHSDTPSGMVAADSSNVFAAALYHRLADGTNNLCFSPYSISAAMAFAMLGAGGDTGVEIRRAMHYPDYDTKLHAGMARLAKSLNARSERDSLELSVANALWADNGFDVAQRYQTHLHRFYNATIQRTDFIGAPEAARDDINQWTLDRTEGKIADIFPPGSITTDTRLVVVNAIYFHAPWALPFPEDNTETAAFKRSDGSQVDTDMMHVKSEFPYTETDAYQAIELPYKGDQLAMLVLLPREDHTLADVEDAITTDTVNEVVTRPPAGARTVDTFLPRFRITYAHTLNHDLIDMGMPGAFQPGANFSGISKDADLFIAMVVHKAFIDVTEEGTEAAAATGISIGKTSARVPQSLTFRADHPFVFIIKDNKTGVILFMGRVMDPSANT